MIKGFFFGGALLFAALPGTGNYQLRDYGFGSGGGTTGTSNYSLEGIAGELSSQYAGTDTYGLHPGLLGSQFAHVPQAPSWTNPDEWYNRLQLVINTSNNPADTTYAVAISTDSFVTTRYVQNDSTVGASLGPEDFRTFLDWGGLSGSSVIGLAPNTTYQVKVKARQGAFTETGFGPAASAATVQASIVFDIDIANTDIETAPPYQVAFGTVAPDTIVDSPELIWLDIASNADNGAFVYVVSDNSGLFSSTSNHTIVAATGDLGLLDEGIGIQNSSVQTTDGGPLVAPAPYNGVSNSIGAVDGQFRQFLTSSGPLKNGRASFLLKLKTTSVTPAAPDYIDVYTLIASAGF